MVECKTLMSMASVRQSAHWDVRGSHSALGVGRAEDNEYQERCQDQLQREY
jgi:hypothetical protein